jgi:hypothetical protein
MAIRRRERSGSIAHQVNRERGSPIEYVPALSAGGVVFFGENCRLLLGTIKYHNSTRCLKRMREGCCKLPSVQGVNNDDGNKQE